ncbi:hypothetical protein CAOG_08675, partial [Capsaspora owczarzaki ATCC 30864]
VADFGLTRSAPAQTAAQSYIQTQTIQGTRQYICPQYRDEGKVSIKTDVYSYGMILLELLTAKQPGIELAGAVKRAIKKQGQLDSELDASIVWGAPDKLAATAVAEVAVPCLESDRVDRPTFGQITCRLRGEPEEVEEHEDKCMICRVIPTSYEEGAFNQTFVP